MSDFRKTPGVDGETPGVEDREVGAVDRIIYSCKNRLVYFEQYLPKKFFKKEAFHESD